MNRLLLAALAAAVLAPAAPAHFVFIVPQPDGSKVTVVFSDDLSPDGDVDVKKIAGLTLWARGADGKDAAVKHAVGKDVLTADLPGSGPRVLYGSIAYGVMKRGDAKPYMLNYHPKALVGPVPADKAAVGDKLPAELIPVIEGGTFRLKFLAAGKPVAAAEVTVIKPDGNKDKVTTAADGITPAINGSGRFGAWTKTSEAKTGEHEGKKFEEVRHYATLVFDAAPVGLPAMPTGVSSFGAIACDGFVYAYGGHAGKTHSYDTASVLGTFHRLKIDGGTAWEPLPGGPILQGVNLAAHDGKVYRVGGMQPRNAPGEPSDNISLVECARFDQKAGVWESLPPLPAGRSSHDVVVAGSKLVVVGGWQMRGKGESSVWPDYALVLDLTAKEPKWTSIPQPFKRRALTATAVGSKVYVIAGLTEDAKATRQVDVLDVATGKWSTGPELPGGDRVGFSPAATTVSGRVVVNTSAGPVYRLTEAGDAWEQVGTAAKKRMVARLVPAGPDAVLLLGGASGGSNATEVERIALPARGEKVTAAPMAK